MFSTDSIKYNLNQDFEKETETKVSCQTDLPDKEGNFLPEAVVHEESEI